MQFYLYPTIKGDYYGTWGIAYMWPNQEALDSSRRSAKVLAVVFAFSATNLFISLVLTITTPPGLIPEDREWDMPDASQEDQRPPDNESRELLGAPSSPNAGVNAEGGQADAPRGTI